MRPLDRLHDIVDAVTGHDEEPGDKTGSPAAASGGATRPVEEPGEVSQGGSGVSDPATSGGGADAVPGTPDATPSTGLGSGAEV